MSHSINKEHYHERFHPPAANEISQKHFEEQDKFDQAVRFLVAQEIDREEAIEMVKAEGAEKFLAQRDAPAVEGEEASPAPKPKKAKKLEPKE